MKTFLKKYWVFILLLFVLFLSMPFLFTFERKMFWDITLINLPWRYHLSESINNGVLPLWNPYMNNGFPQMGHYETWYPISWVIALLFKYDLQVLQYEYIFNLFIAGIGFYKLSSLIIGLSKPTRLSGAIAYMLCGVFISQASHLGYLTAGAWMTFVFYYLIKLLQSPNWKDGTHLVLVYYFLMTGGYAGNTIVITYICFIIFIYYIIKNIRIKQVKKLKKLLTITSVLILIFSSMYAIVLYTTIDLHQNITRKTLEYTAEGFGAMTGSNSFASYLSLFLPSVSGVKNDFWQSSAMLNNSYIGFLFAILPLFYLVYGKTHKTYKIGVYLFVFGIFFMLTSVAIQFPIHKVLYSFVPFLDQFRFPSLYRIFFILSFILLSLISIDLISKSTSHKKKFKYWLCGLMLISSITLLFTNRIDLNLLFTSFDDTIKSYDIKEMLHIDSLLILILSSITLFLMWKKSNNFNFSILVIIGIDLIIHTWILTPKFVSMNINPKPINESINSIPEGFPLINQKIAIINNTDITDSPPNLWLNKYAYYKYPQLEGSSPYSVNSYSTSILNGDYDILKNYPFISIFSDFKNNKIDSNFYEPVLSKKIVSTHTTPNQFDFIINNSKDKYVVFNHNSYKYWQFYENGKKLKPRIVSTNYMSVKLTSNDSILKIKFEPKIVTTLFFLALFGFSVLIILVTYFRVKNKLHL